MLREDFNRGIAALREFGLVYDILIFERHLPQTIQFVDRHPDQVFVLDHLAKALVKVREMSPWAERIAELAKRPKSIAKSPDSPAKLTFTIGPKNSSSHTLMSSLRHLVRNASCSVPTGRCV
jgi:hypothetical protein